MPRKKIKKFDWKGFFRGILLSVLILTACFFLFTTTETYQTIFYPAYLSVASVCFPEGDKYVESKGYIQAGQFNLSDQSISIFIEDNDGRVQRHENCHRSQFLQGKIYRCDRIIFLYLLELEAYYSESHDYAC